MLSKKPILQLGILDTENALLVLSDGVITVHSLNSPTLLKRETPSLSKINAKQQCTLFSVDKSEGGLWRMVVALKRKLIVTEWNGSDFIVKKELSVPDVVKTCVWCGQSLCIGFRREYNLIDISTGAMQELFSTGRSNPTVIPMPTQQLLLGRDNISVFIGYDGKPTRRFGLSWLETPIATALSYPYVVSILPQRGVEIQLIFGALTQSLPTNVTGAFIAVAPEGETYIASRIKGGPIYRLTPVPFAEQIESLVKRKKFSEALTLCENLESHHVPERDERLKYLKLLNAYNNFNTAHYTQAMETFLELDIDPIKVIALYPGLLPQKLKSKYVFEIPIEELKGHVALAKALEPLATYLEQKRKDLKLSESLKKCTSGGGYGKTDNDSDSLIGGIEQVEWNDTTALGQIIDTTLLRCYVMTNPQMATTLLSVGNYCHVKECVQILKTNSKFKELVQLYRGRGLHRSALEQLHTLGSDYRMNDNKELTGVKASIDYMKSLGKDHIDLILQFSTWVLKLSPREGLDIFLNLRKQSQQLPPMRVLSHLENLAQHVDSIASSGIVVTYLEFVVNELGETSEDFHNRLVSYYFEAVIKLKKETKDPSISKQVAGTEPGLLGKTRAKLIDFLERSKHYNYAMMLSRFTGTFVAEGLHEERAVLLSKIGHHGEALREYVHELHDFEMAERYCQQHYDTENEEAKDVYLSLLKVYLTTPGQDSLTTASQDSLTPPGQDSPSEEELKKKAFRFLNKYYKEIDTVKALEAIPESTPISVLYPYFEKVLRDINKTRRNNQVIANLQKCETMKVKAEYLKLRSRVVRITEDTTCVVCKRRLGDAIFALYPTLSTDLPVTVHYLCYKNQKEKNVCPVTGEKFGDPI